MADHRLGSLVMEVAGKGAPVVMIHGLGGTSNSFQPLLSQLGAFQIIRPDLPGAGRSALRPGLAGLAGLAAAVEEGLRSLNLSKAHFVGHSMGTLVCQILAAKRPDLVASLTLFGALTEPPAAARQALQERAQQARKDGMAGIADAVSQASVAQGQSLASAAVRESLLRQSPEGYARHCEALSRFQALDPALITCPTLLVVGEFDPVAPPAMADQLLSGLPQGRAQYLPGVGHWMMQEAPEESAELLADHLNQHSL
ncbi:alpha/beta fold hydrolase [Rhodovibrionaceae bacterium A322]